MYAKMTTNLMVESVNKAIAFYKEVLGFSVVISVPGKENELQFAILAKDELSLMLQERNSLTDEYPILNTLKVQPSVSLYIEVDNLDTHYKEIKSKHVVYTELHISFYGAKEFAITDADGYVLTFAENKPI